LPGWLFNRRKLLADPKLLGRWGEKRAERFLKKRGLKKLAGNFTCRRGEIDLVMVEPDGSVVFVEVKTRADERFGPVESVVTRRKRDRLFAAARCFLARYRIEQRPFRFDVIAVVLGRSGNAQIRYYQNTFVP